MPASVALKDLCEVLVSESRGVFGTKPTSDRCKFRNIVSKFITDATDESYEMEREPSYLNTAADQRLLVSIKLK